MGTLFVVKEFGHYHFFATAELCQEFLASLNEWERKAAQIYEVKVV